MGIYDRDYLRDEPSRSGFADWPMTYKLIAVNVAIFVIDMFTDSLGHGWRWLDFHLALKPDLLAHPWNFWQLLTCGFVHSPTNFQHILFNMIALWMFGLDVERIYGPKEFLRLYLSLW